VIPFGRTYNTPPRVVVSLGRVGTVATYGMGTVSVWVDTVTTTNFTLAIHASNTNVREVTWHAKPKRTDVTP
jgi:hypothetical protein